MHDDVERRNSEMPLINSTTRNKLQFKQANSQDVFQDKVALPPLSYKMAFIMASIGVCGSEHEELERLINSVFDSDVVDSEGEDVQELEITFIEKIMVIVVIVSQLVATKLESFEIYHSKTLFLVSTYIKRPTIQILFPYLSWLALFNIIFF
ncbi:hypothetical protein C0J52_05156 [Blattella germanica]|nr:hypothetical protein C0J52_05156 [Blattella germanica]